MAEAIKALLCPLSFAERIVKCAELLAGSLEEAVRPIVLYFQAHAYRTLHLPEKAADVCHAALGLPMTGEQRALFLECLALSLYDRGHLYSVPVILEQMAAIDLTGSDKRATLEAHMTMLRGLFLLHAGKFDKAYPVLCQAEGAMLRIGNTHSAATVQEAVAMHLLLKGDLDGAQVWIRKINGEAGCVTALLVEAELMVRRGDVEAAVSLIAAAESHPHFESRHRARMLYLQALRLRREGSFLASGVSLTMAMDALEADPIRDLALVDSLNGLRAGLAREEVA